MTTKALKREELPATIEGYGSSLANKIRIDGRDAFIQVRVGNPGDPDDLLSDKIQIQEVEETGIREVNGKTLEYQVAGRTYTCTYAALLFEHPDIAEYLKTFVNEGDKIDMLVSDDPPSQHYLKIIDTIKSSLRTLTERTKDRVTAGFFEEIIYEKFPT